MATEINPIYQVFQDVDGEPLESGYLYIGTYGLNPEVSPISVYWDAALTVPAAQPIRTIGGYPSQSGAPGRLFVAEVQYSMTVRNKNGSLVHSELSIDDPEGTLRADLANASDLSKGASLVGRGAQAFDNKAQAVTVAPVNNILYYVGGTDGGLFRGVTGAAAATYSDDGGSYCGTVFIPTGGDGSTAYLRIYDGAVMTPWFGVSDTTGTVDEMAIIQLCLDNFDDVEHPAPYHSGVSGTLSMTTTSRNFTIAGDLSRTGASTAPLLQINASRCTMQRKGSSRIFGINALTAILVFGPLDPTTEPDTNVLWSRADLSLTGNLAAGTRGVAFYTTEAHGGGGATYFNTFTGLIENVEDGAYLTANANGNKLTDIDFYRISGNCIHGNGTDGSTGNLSDCYASNISAHFSSGLNAILKLQDANRNTFTNIGGEPGAGAKLTDFDATSTNNYFDGYANTGTASVDNGNNNIRAYNGFTRYSSTQGSGGFLYIEEGTYTPTLTPVTSGSITLNSSSDLLSVTRLGRFINVHGTISVSSVSAPTGDLRISLPHTIDSAGAEGEFSTTGTILIANAAGNINQYGLISGGGNAYVTVRRTDTTAFVQCAADFSGNEVIYINLTYRSLSSI